MKILLLNDELYTTGASIAMLRLAERLMLRHEVVAMARIKGEGEIKKQFEVLGVPVVERVRNVDLAVANTVLCGELVGQNGAYCPVIWWMHESEIGRDILTMHPQFAAGFKSAMQIVFQTEYQRKIFAPFLAASPAQVQVLPFWNGAIYRGGCIAPAPKQKKRIVCIGTVEPRKRMEDTILATDLLDSALKEQIECVFIGRFLRLDPAVGKLALAHPERYIFLGELSNEATLAYLASADVFVLASSSESQPLTIWEAFELNVPACLSDLESYRYMGLRHGRHALMHPVGDIASLAGNLKTLLGDAAVTASITRAAKGLLSDLLAHDWTVEFECIVERVAARWKSGKRGY